MQAVCNATLLLAVRCHFDEIQLPDSTPVVHFVTRVTAHVPMCIVG